MDIRIVGTRIVWVGILAAFGSVFWGIAFYSTLASRLFLKSNPKSPLDGVMHCIFFDSDVCSRLKMAASFAGYTTYSPVLFWISIVILVLGWALRFMPQEIAISARKNTKSYDVAKWSALLNYDAEIALVAEKLKPLGDKWVDKFATSYLVLNDKSYLLNIAEKIIAEARGASERQKRLEDLPPMPGRKGPSLYKGHQFYEYPTGRVDGHTGDLGWHRFLTFHEFVSHIDSEQEQ